MNEKEYIERKALIAEYDRVHVGAPGGARKLMVDAPAADVVEVVRCKNCKFADRVDKDTMFCRRKILGLVTDESFCSFARRKEQT